MSDSDRSIPAYIRKEVRSRDGNRCRKCGFRKGLEFHHIIPFVSVGRNSKFAMEAHQKSNLILLCNQCHKQAPNDPFETFKWLKSYPNLPPNFSKCLELLNMGIPMLIMKSEELYNKGYYLSTQTNDWKILIEDIQMFLHDLWDCQITMEHNKFDWKPLTKMVDKYIPSTDVCNKANNLFKKSLEK